MQSQFGFGGFGGMPPLNCPHSGVSAPGSPGGALVPGFEPEAAQFWQQVLVQVYSAAAAVEEGRSAEAKQLVADALLHITSSFAASPEFGMTCSLGVAAAYRVLASAYFRDPSLLPHKAAMRRARQIALRFQHLANVWVTHVWEKFARRKEPGSELSHYEMGYIDNSAWPITVQDINVEMTIVQRDLEADGRPMGHRPRWPGVPHDLRVPALRLGIVSLCAYPEDHVLPGYAVSNHELYARRHGYRYHVAREKLDSTRPPAWGKVQLMYQALREPDVDWWLWFDCDTFFMNMTVTLDSLLFKHAGAAGSAEAFAQSGVAALELDRQFHMVVAEDHAMLNTGAFFLRSSQWSLDTMERVWGSDASVWVDHPWWENAAILWDFLKGNSEKFRHEDQRLLFADPGAEHDDMEGIYPQEVRLAPQSEFNSYHPATSHFQHDTWEPGKFVLAFNGVLSNTSPKVVQALYGNYYELACELNDIQDQCVAVKEPLPWLSGAGRIAGSG